MGTETVNASNAYASTPLTPQAGGNEVVVSRLDELLKGFTFQMANCQMDAAPETVHDLRVVIRRLIAFMDVIRGTVPSKSGREIQEALGSLRNRVNDLRNLQVMVPALEEPSLQGEALESFKVYLQAKIRRQAARVEEKVASFNIMKFIRKVNTLREKLTEIIPSEEPPLKFEENLDKLFRRVSKRAKGLDAGDPRSFHSLRTALRDFRYRLEVIKPLLPEYPAENIKLLKQAQDALGEVQNRAVFLAVVEDFASRNPEMDTGTLLNHFTLRLQEAIGAAGENTAFAALWRADGASPFPWQQGHSG